MKSQKPKNDKNKANRTTLILFIVACVLCCVSFSILAFAFFSQNKVEEVPYTQFLQDVENGEVERIEYSSGANTIKVSIRGEERYKTQNPKYEDFKKDMLEAGIEVEENRQIFDLLTKLMPLLYIGAIGYMATTIIGQRDSDFDFSSDSEDEVPSVTFDDVKGQDEVKADMQLYVSFLKNPEAYKNIGGEMPKGVLLYGPPGTGKTLMAKAVAGEAGVRFKAVNGSDFEEMFKGLGAKRVRNLFKWAKRHAPCILFIDEIDAVGAARGNKNGDGDSQTLNALLSAIDGFDGSNGVFLMAATNRIEDLDPALIRAKRFDHHFAMSIPTTATERREIIDLYVRNKKLDESVDLEKLAKETMGFSPAAIDSLLNESALIAAHKGLTAINQECIEEAWFKETMQGHPKKRSERDAHEIEITAYHEAGHALVACLFGKDVRKVSIIPSTSGAGGYTAVNPDETGMQSITDLKNEIKVLYAGRVAEELFAGKDGITTGASNDIQEASKVIMSMIVDYGMSEMGMINLSVVSVDSEKIAQYASEMATRLAEDARGILTGNREALDRIARTLVERETITGEELSSLVAFNTAAE